MRGLLLPSRLGTALAVLSASVGNDRRHDAILRARGTHLVVRVGRRLSIALVGHGHGHGAPVALGTVPEEPAHALTLPAVTTATRPARGAAGP